MGSALRVIGFTLWIPALLLLVMSTACGAFVGGSAVNSTGESVTRLKNQTADQLERIEGLNPQIATNFRTSGTIADETKAALEPRVREQVDRALGLYNAGMAGTALGVGGATSVAGIGVIAVYVVCLPLFVVGLLLTRKKDVWRCPTCQFIFDRG